MEARRVPSESKNNGARASFRAPSVDGAVPHRADVRSINTAASKVPSVDRPSVRSLNGTGSAAREVAPRTSDTSDTPAASQTDQAVTVFTPGSEGKTELRVVLPEDASVQSPQTDQDVEVPQSVVDKSTSRTSTRSGGASRRATIAGAAAAGVMSVAACGGGPSPDEGGADPNLTTYTAVCAKPYTREGLTRWQEVQMDQSPRPGAESERLQEVVADGNDDASEWYQPFEGQSNDRNKMPIVWPCRPGTSIYELDPGSNGAYLNPGAVEAQDPTAMRYVNRTHGDS